MTDRDVQREIEANEERADRHERDGDEGIVETVEDIVNPLVDVIRCGDADPDLETVEDRVRQNDAEQRPG